MGFMPSKAESDIWMRENNGLYEYSAVYVDDLLIAARDPEGITKMIENTHQLKLKDEDGINKYQTMIGCLQWAVSLGRFDIQTATNWTLKSSKTYVWLSQEVCKCCN
jgi:hypothetical protein